MTHNNEEKWRTVERLMKLGTVLVHINSRNCLSVIPDHLVGRDQVVFQIGHDMPVPIRDLQLNERGFSGTLSFSGVGSWVYVVWEDVYAVVSDNRVDSKIWFDSLPPRLARSLRGEAEQIHDDPNVVSLNAYRERTPKSSSTPSRPTVRTSKVKAKLSHLKLV